MLEQFGEDESGYSGEGLVGRDECGEEAAAAKEEEASGGGDCGGFSDGSVMRLCFCLTMKKKIVDRS